MSHKAQEIVLFNALNLRNWLKIKKIIRFEIILVNLR